jgi:hypothetical protein
MKMSRQRHPIAGKRAPTVGGASNNVGASSKPVAAWLASGSNFKYATAGKPDCYRIL